MKKRCIECDKEIKKGHICKTCEKELRQEISSYTQKK